MANGRPWSARDEADLIRLFRSGWRTPAIARHLDMPKRRVQAKICNLRRDGDKRLQLRERRYSELEIARIITMRAAGRVAKEIARATGRTPDAIYKILRRLHEEGRIDESLRRADTRDRTPRRYQPVRRRWAA